MEAFLKTLLGGASGFGAYALVFGVLTACGLGLPLPEDVSLILGGFLAHKGAASLTGMMITGMAGILVGDSLIFYGGRRFGGRVGKGGAGPFSKLITPEKRARVEALFHKHGDKIVMIARFMPGVRAVAYFTAGSVGMKYRRFLFWDGLASLLSAPVFVFLGYYFGGQLDKLIERLKEGQMGVFGGLIVVVGTILLVKAWRRRRQRAAGTETTPTLPSLSSISSAALVPELAPKEERQVADQSNHG